MGVLVEDMLMLARLDQQRPLDREHGRPADARRRRGARRPGGGAGPADQPHRRLGRGAPGQGRRGTAPPGHRQPDEQRAVAHPGRHADRRDPPGRHDGRDPGRDRDADRPASGTVSGKFRSARRPYWRSPTTALGSAQTRLSTRSSGSTGPTRPGRPAAPVSGSPSSRRWWPRTAARSGSGRSRGRAPRSRSRCRWRPRPCTIPARMTSQDEIDPDAQPVDADPETQPTDDRTERGRARPSRRHA